MNDVNITISDNVIAVSNLEIGVTITQVAPDKTTLGTSQARQNINTTISAMPTAIYNVHAFEFGVTNNVLTNNWKDLDRRLSWLVATGAQKIMLTFWSAPDDMLIASTHPRYKVIAPEKINEYAELVYQTLVRYRDYPITHIQIWNELKGYGFYYADWDITSYTHLYNAIYTRIRYDFPTIKIGGPYLIADYNHLDYNIETLNYFYDNAQGMNAVCVDYALTHKVNDWSLQDYIHNSHRFSVVPHMLKEYEGLEYWSSENYIISDLTKYGQFPIQYQACWSACLLYYELLAGVNVSLAWGLQGDAALPYEGIQRSWCYDTRSSFRAGETTPIYDIYRIFNYCFSPGTEIVESASTDPMVLVLASKDFVLVINTHDTQKNVFVEGKLRTLEGYQFGMYNRIDQ